MADGRHQRTLYFDISIKVHCSPMYNSVELSFLFFKPTTSPFGRTWYSTIYIIYVSLEILVLNHYCWISIFLGNIEIERNISFRGNFKIPLIVSYCNLLTQYLTWVPAPSLELLIKSSDFYLLFICSFCHPAS